MFVPPFRSRTGRVSISPHTYPFQNIPPWMSLLPSSAVSVERSYESPIPSRWRQEVNNILKTKQLQLNLLIAFTFYIYLLRRLRRLTGLKINSPSIALEYYQTEHKKTPKNFTLRAENKSQQGLTSEMAEGRTVSKPVLHGYGLMF